MEIGTEAAVDGGTRDVATDAVAVGIDIVVAGARVAPASCGSKPLVHAAARTNAITDKAAGAERTPSTLPRGQDRTAKPLPDR